MKEQKTSVRVPLILTESLESSGTACLAMLLAYYGLDVGSDGVNGVCAESRHSDNTQRLVFIAQGFGMECQAVMLQPSLLQETEFPCILKMRSGEYVVYNGRKGKKALLTYPSCGEVAITDEKLLEAFGGECITLKPSSSFIPTEKKQKAQAFFKSELKSLVQLFAAAAICMAFGCLISLCFPAAFRVLIDRVVSGKDNWLSGVVWTIAIAGALSLFVAGIKSLCIFKLTAAMSANTDKKVFRRLQNCGSTYFSGHTSGDVQELLESSRKLAEQTVSCIVTFVFYASAMLFYIVFALCLSPLAALPGVCALLIGFCGGLFIYLKGKNPAAASYLDERSEKLRIAEAENFTETLGRNGFAKSFSTEKSHSLCKKFGLFGFLGICIKVVALLGLAASAASGVSLALNGQSAGIALSVLCILCLAFADSEKVFGKIMLFNSLKCRATFIDNFLRYPIADETEKFEIQGRISFDGVSFGYDELQSPVLDKVSFKAEKGARYALVGEGASGKTTLAKLICGQLIPRSGDILYDDRSVYDTRSSLEKNAVYSSSACVIFHGTIRDNIRMFDQSITDDEILRAALKSGLSYSLYSFEGGLDYVLSEDVRRLSEGEKQLIAFTRLLLFAPKVIVLDNALCALHSQREEQLLDCLREQGSTVFVVTNRAKIAAASDKVLYIKKGKVISRQHVELMTSDREYQRLFV